MFKRYRPTPYFLAALAVLLAVVTFSANAAIILTNAKNADNSYTTEYPAGNKPIGGSPTCPPTGYTYATLGDGGGTFCDVTGTTTAVVTGTDAVSNSRIIYKSCGSADCEIKAEINNDYAGNSVNNVAFGVGIRSDATSAADVMQCKSIRVSSQAVQCQARISAVNTNVDCPLSGTTRPVRTAVTWDDSENAAKGFTSVDSGATWQECLSATFSTFSAPSAFFIGGSKSATVAASASFDNIAQGTTITVYTPPTAGGPTLLDALDNQTGVQSSAVAFTQNGISSNCVAANFSGATSYSVSGLSGSTGLSFNTSTACFSGTFAAGDVGNNSVTVTATNVGGSLPAAFSLVVSAVPGDTLVVSGATINCATYEGGGAANQAVDPGDILEIPGGTRGPIEFTNCHGTAAKPIIIRNKTSDAQARIQRSSGGGNAFTITDSTDWVLDGSGGYSGSGSGTVGYDGLGVTGAKASTASGISIEATGGSSGFLLKIGGTSCTGVNTTANALCKVTGVKFDGGNTSGAAIYMNDHTVLYNACISGKSAAAIAAQCWRQNVEISNNYIVRAGDIGAQRGEGMYVGPNQDASDPDLPLRNININHNYFTHTARDCINTKSVLDGSNYMEYNWCAGYGEGGETTQNRGLNMNGAANWEIRGNVVLNGGGAGMLMNWQDLADLSPNAASSVLNENNIFANLARTTNAQTPNAMRFTHANGTPTQTMTIRNITIAGVPGAAFDCDAGVGGAVSNSIIAGVTDDFNGSGCTDTNNRAALGASAGDRATAITNQNFVTFSNDDDATNDNFELGATAGACNKSNNDSLPAIDYEGATRPADLHSDQGADEATACP